jgi:hypothetical protein
MTCADEIRGKSLDGDAATEAAAAEAEAAVAEI